MHSDPYGGYAGATSDPYGGYAPRHHTGIACILWDASWITLGYIELLIHE